MAFDRERLVKLMGLTQSPNTHEAAAALRAANRLLRENGTTWAEILTPEDKSQPMKVDPEFTTPPPEEWTASIPRHLKDAATIDELFRTIYSQPRFDAEEFWQYVDRSHQRYLDHGNVTQDQYNVLRRAYARTRHGKTMGFAKRGAGMFPVSEALRTDPDAAP